jgi:isopentenyldiphosphate isomerase
MEDRQGKSKMQSSREAAIKRLVKEIGLTRKSVDNFLKVMRITEREAMLLTVPYPAMIPDYKRTYETYKCMHKRIKMLQGLLEGMEDTVRLITRL